MEITLFSYNIEFEFIIFVIISKVSLKSFIKLERGNTQERQKNEEKKREKNFRATKP